MTYLKVRKYYFLNNKKQWRGPYWLPQVLFYSLTGTIKPYTYLWHNKLSQDGCEHPLHCIYGRKKAFEFGFLPFWLFGSNLKIIAANLINWIKKRLKKKDSWDRLLQKPIETPSVLKVATNVFLIPSLTAIHDFGGTGEFAVKLIYVERDTKEAKSLQYPILISSDKKPGIRFEITMAEPPQVGGVLHKESYGLHHHLLLKNGYEDISVAKDCVFDFSTRFPYKPQILKGRFSQANLMVPSDYKNSFNRLVLKIEDDKPIGPLDIIMRSGSHLYDYEKFNVHPSLMGMSFRTGGGYAEVKIEEKHYRFYEVSDSIYLIDGIDREDLEQFKQKAEVMRIALAILCGKFYGGQCSYVTSGTPDFKNIEGIWYEIERNSVLSNCRVIDLQFFRTTFKETDAEYTTKFKPVNKAVDTMLFSDLCNALWKDDNLLHAAELVISGMGNSDPVQQGALYSVALETLTSTLGNTKAKDLRPVDDDAVFKNIKEDLINGLENYKAGISQDGFTILQRKIESLNTPANQDKLTKTFELFGITPTEEDKKAIKNRNSYLHGRSPLNRTQQFELTQISLKLHTLIVSLLLKSVGYFGHIINLDVQVYLTDEGKLFDIVSEQSATIKKSLAEMQKASDEQDETAFNSAKGKLSKYLEENKLSNMVRII
ncbi:MAG: hypothetical protein JST58_03215 [Bacteroidetes bacterium]|nr:hypothetical protein [Bacteroidota bacterium]